jgi:hypothetical protein
MASWSPLNTHWASPSGRDIDIARINSLIAFRSLRMGFFYSPCRQTAGSKFDKLFQNFSDRLQSSPRSPSRYWKFRPYENERPLSGFDSITPNVSICPGGASRTWVGCEMALSTQCCL